MPSTARDFQHCLLHIDIFDSSFRNRRSESCSSEPERPRSAWISSVKPVQALLHRTSDEVKGERTPLRRGTRIKQHGFRTPSNLPMTTADDPDVLDVEFRELPATPRRTTTPAARCKSRSRAARREAAAERRIGLQHLAFFRGYLEDWISPSWSTSTSNSAATRARPLRPAPDSSPPSSPRPASARTSRPRASSRSGRPPSPRRRRPMPRRTPRRR